MVQSTPAEHTKDYQGMHCRAWIDAAATIEWPNMDMTIIWICRRRRPLPSHAGSEGAAPVDNMSVLPTTQIDDTQVVNEKKLEQNLQTQTTILKSTLVVSVSVT